MALEGGAAPEQGMGGAGEEESGRRLNRVRIHRHGRKGTNEDQGFPSGAIARGSSRPMTIRAPPEGLSTPRDLGHPTTIRWPTFFRVTCTTREEALSTDLLMLVIGQQQNGIEESDHQLSDATSTSGCGYCLLLQAAAALRTCGTTTITLVPANLHVTCYSNFHPRFRCI